VIFASSVNAVFGYPPDIQVKLDMPIRPINLYGATKVWGEGVASSYASSTDLSCISLRFGWVVDRNSPLIAMGHRYLDIAFTYEDLTNLVQGAIDAPDDLKLGVFHGISNNKWKRLDITESIRQLGYNPQDDAFEIALANANKTPA
jgi:uronate dehydrogenase